MKRIIKKILNKVLSVLGGNKTKMDTKSIFERIYENKVWGESNGSRFYSGSGSDEAYSSSYIQIVKEFINRNRIESVVDLGCGDFRIGSKICETGVSYIGIDIVSSLIAHHNEQYSSDKVKFIGLDIVKEKLPNGELCLIRQVLQHLSNGQIKKVVKKIKKYKFAIVTEHLPIDENSVPNLDKEPNGDIRLGMNSGVYLDRAPYNLRLEKLLEVFPNEHPNSRIVTFLVRATI